MSKQNICPPKINKINSNWKQHGITVVGGYGWGNQLHQLTIIFGIHNDDNKTLLIADTNNHRIVEWKYNTNSSEIIAGRNGQGNRPNQLLNPIDVTVDKEKNAIIICDAENDRIMRWFRQSQTNPQILIFNIACGGVAMDKYGSIYVSDMKRSEVRRWKEGDTDGILVAGGNGAGYLPNQFQSPGKIFVDDEYSVYVADINNHRIMKWEKNSKEGIIVAGGNGEGDSLNQLVHPQGLVIDNLGQIFIADTGNSRIMRWREGDAHGSIVVGGNGIGNGLNQLYYPRDLSFDVEGNLYVADSANYRIQKYDLYTA